MREIKTPSQLRYPESRIRLAPGQYFLEVSDGIKLGYRRNKLYPEWFLINPDRPKRHSVIAVADDYWPPDGIQIKDCGQALAAVLDYKDGVHPGCVSPRSGLGYPRREFPHNLMLSAWEVAGTLTAAEVLGGGGWGFTWANTEGMRERGLTAWPCYVHLIDIPGNESIARLSGKVIRLFAGGQSLNESNQDAMKAALKASGLAFTDDEYRRASALLSGRFQQVRTVFRKAVRQMRMPPGKPQGERKYEIWQLLQSEPPPLPPEYAGAVMSSWWIVGTFSQAPSRHYPLPPEIGPL